MGKNKDPKATEAEKVKTHTEAEKAERRAELEKIVAAHQATKAAKEEAKATEEAVLKEPVIDDEEAVDVGASLAVAAAGILEEEVLGEPFYVVPMSGQPAGADLNPPVAGAGWGAWFGFGGK